MSERKYRKGDLVQFQLGLRTVSGEIKEDRGPIGIKGRHLYLVEFRRGPRDDEAVSLVELPAEEFQYVQKAVSQK